VEIVSAGVFADGVMTRAMDPREFAAWNFALLVTELRKDDPTDAADRLAREANSCELRSIRAELRGRHEFACVSWLLSELYDAAVKGLVR
jgi:hypothetical protein